MLGLRSGFKFLAAPRLAARYSTMDRAVSENRMNKKDGGTVLLAAEAMRQAGKEDIDWNEAMETIQEVESRFPLRRPTDKERMFAVTDNMSFNLAKLANQSETLRGMLDLGIGLWKWEEKDMGKMALELNLHKDVMPRVQFLRDLGLSPESISELITENGPFLQQDMDHLQTRVDYLTQMGFTANQIVSVVTGSAYWLTYDIKRIDARLGFLQKHFDLSDAEVRAVAVKCPRLITWRGLPAQVSLNKLVLKDFISMSKTELKKLLLACPELYMRKHEDKIKEVVSFLMDEVGYPKELVLKFPEALNMMLPGRHERLEFLRLLKRDQFDPAKPNYVSPEMLLVFEDKQFCRKVAKVPEELFRKFLKSC